MWQPRAFKHPEKINATTQIVAEPLRIYAACVVLVFFPQPTFTTLDAAEQKILDGMISVLNLNATQLMVAKVFSVEPDCNLLAHRIAEWQPKTVLQLSMQMPAIQCAAPIVCTFSPQYLLHNAQHKPQAYKDLLKLRKLIDHDQ